MIPNKSQYTVVQNLVATFAQFGVHFCCYQLVNVNLDSVLIDVQMLSSILLGLRCLSTANAKILPSNHIKTSENDSWAHLMWSSFCWFELFLWMSDQTWIILCVSGVYIFSSLPEMEQEYLCD